MNMQLYEKKKALFLLTKVSDKKNIPDIDTLYTSLLSLEDKRITTLLEAFIALSKKDKNLSIVFLDPRDETLQVDFSNPQICAKMRSSNGASFLVIKPKTKAPDSIRMSHTQRCLLHEICHYVVSKINPDLPDLNLFQNLLADAEQKTLRHNLSLVKGIKSILPHSLEKHKARKFAFGKASNLHKSYNKKDRAEEMLCESYGFKQYMERHPLRRTYIEKTFTSILHFQDIYFNKRLEDYVHHNAPSQKEEPGPLKGDVVEMRFLEEIQLVTELKKMAESYAKGKSMPFLEKMGEDLSKTLNFPLRVGILGSDPALSQVLKKALCAHQSSESEDLGSMVFFELPSSKKGINKEGSPLPFPKNIDIALYPCRKNFTQENLIELKELQGLFKNRLFLVANGLEDLALQQGKRAGFLDEERAVAYSEEIAKQVKEAGLGPEDIFMIATSRSLRLDENTRKESLDSLISMLSFCGEEAKIEHFNKYLTLYQELFVSAYNKYHKTEFLEAESFLEKLKDALSPEVKVGHLLAPENFRPHIPPKKLGHTLDREFLEKNSTFKLDALSQEAQFSQILNLSPNCSDDKNLLGDMMDRYLRIFQDLSDATFKKSMVQSMEHLRNPHKLQKKIEDLQNNTVNSFLLNIFFSDDHTLPLIFRKIEDKVSVILVNKIHHEIGGQYVEFIFNEKNRDFSKLLNPEPKITTDEFYLNFCKACDNFCVLGLVSGGQKDFNCFVKEPEAALKFLFSTKDFSPKAYLKLREGEENFHPKWPLDTLKTRHLYLESLLEDKADPLHTLEEKLKVYSMNKTFRKLLKEGSSVSTAIKLAFAPSSDLQAFKKNLSLETLVRSYQEIHKFLSQSSNPCLSKTIEDIKDIYDKEYYVEFDKKLFEKLDKDFTFISGQLRENAGIKLRQKALATFEIKERIDYLDKALSLNPKFAEGYCLKGDLKLDKENNQESLQYYRKAQELMPLNRKYKERENLAKDLIK